MSGIVVVYYKFTLHCPFSLLRLRYLQERCQNGKETGLAPKQLAESMSAEEYG